MKELIIKDGTGFRLRLTIKDVVSPTGLNNIEFHQESKNRNGEIDFTSVYQFFLSTDELLTLGHFLVNMDQNNMTEYQNKSFITKVFSKTDPE
jgi:hypothetical protein